MPEEEKRSGQQGPDCGKKAAEEKNGETRPAPSAVEADAGEETPGTKVELQDAGEVDETSEAAKSRISTLDQAYEKGDGAEGNYDLGLLPEPFGVVGFFRQTIPPRMTIEP